MATKPTAKPATKTATAPEEKADRRESIDLEPLMTEALGTMPDDGRAFEVCTVKGGKRLDLIRADGTVARLASGKTTRELGALIEGIAIGRSIK